MSKENKTKENEIKENNTLSYSKLKEKVNYYKNLHQDSIHYSTKKLAFILYQYYKSELEIYEESL